MLRADRIVYDEGREPDPRRGPAPPDRPGRRRPHGRQRRADPRPRGGAHHQRAAPHRRQDADGRRRGPPHRRPLRRRSTRPSPAPAPSAPRTPRPPGRCAPRASPRTRSSGASTSRTPASSSSACPVGFLPRLSIPAPGVERASGFLEPRFLQSDIYGFGIKTPYYRVLGPSADATLTPFVTTGGAALIEGEYRQRFANGGFDFWGVFARRRRARRRRRLRPRRLPHHRRVRACRATSPPTSTSPPPPTTASSPSSTIPTPTSSPASPASAAPAPNEYIELGTIAFQSLTDVNESMDVPFVLPAVLLPPPARLPRRGRAGSASRSTRSASCARPAATASAPAGRSTGSATSTLPHGILASGTAQALVDVYQVWDNPDIADGLEVQAAPTLAGELRWPWVRHTGAADHVIEPIVQVVYVRALQDQDEIPNEDSRLPEFDETNLFAFNRFPGLDRLETGLRANLGHQLHPPGPRRLVGGLHARAHPARRPGRRVRRRHRPRRPLVGLRGRRVGRLRLGADRDQPRALRHRLGLPAQRVRPRLRRRRSARSAPPTSTSPRTTATPSSGRSPRPARSRSTPATGCARTGSCAGSGATTSPTALEPARRRRDHLRQRVRRVRPFRLAPLHLIG